MNSDRLAYFEKEFRYTNDAVKARLPNEHYSWRLNDIFEILKEDTEKNTKENNELVKENKDLVEENELLKEKLKAATKEEQVKVCSREYIEKITLTDGSIWLRDVTTK